MLDSDLEKRNEAHQSSRLGDARIISPPIPPLGPVPMTGLSLKSATLASRMEEEINEEMTRMDAAPGEEPRLVLVGAIQGSDKQEQNKDAAASSLADTQRNTSEFGTESDKSQTFSSTELSSPAGKEPAGKLDKFDAELQSSSTATAPVAALPSDTTPSEPAPPNPPKESGYAWVVLIAAFICSLCGWGLIFAGGIWQRYFFTHQTFGEATTQKQLSWVGSIAYASAQVLGVFVGRISDVFGHQKVLAFGTVTFTLSMILSSFATQLWMLYLSQGVLYGLGVCCIYIPAGGTLVTHWTTRRALAISLTGMGSGIGGFIWPQVVQAALDSLGYQWAFRIIGIVVGTCLAVCTVILKPKEDSGKPKGVKRPPLVDTSFFRNKHYWLLSLVGFIVTFGFYVPTYYLAQYASDIGLSPSMGSLLVGLMNGSALFVRVVQAPVSKIAGTSTSFAAAIILGGLCQLLIWPFAKNLGSLLTFTILC